MFSPSQTQKEFQTLKLNLKLCLDGLLQPWLVISVVNVKTIFQTMQLVFSRFRDRFFHISVWTLSINQDLYIQELKILHKRDIYISTQYSNWLWCRINISSPSYVSGFDLKTFYSLLYEKTVCDFKHVNSDYIKRVIGLFNRESELNYFDVNDQVLLSNQKWWISWQTLF